MVAGLLGRGSAGGVAAVDGERDADHEARAGAAQPQHRGGDLVTAAEAADRLTGDGVGERELAAGHHVAGAEAADRLTRDGVGEQ